MGKPVLQFSRITAFLAFHASLGLGSLHLWMHGGRSPGYVDIDGYWMRRGRFPVGPLSTTILALAFVVAYMVYLSTAGDRQAASAGRIRDPVVLLRVDSGALRYCILFAAVAILFTLQDRIWNYRGLH